MLPPTSATGLGSATFGATLRSHTSAVTASRASLRARRAYPSSGRLRSRHSPRPSLGGVLTSLFNLAILLPVAHPVKIAPVRQRFWANDLHPTVTVTLAH